jgi:hypothetical protein
VRRSVVDPQATARQLREQEGGEALRMSVRSVRRTLQQHGRISYRPVAAPNLTPHRKMERLAWARMHQNWNALDWQKVSLKCH